MAGKELISFLKEAPRQLDDAVMIGAGRGERVEIYQKFLGSYDWYNYLGRVMLGAEIPQITTPEDVEVYARFNMLFNLNDYRNDSQFLGSHSHLLGIMPRDEMRGRFRKGNLEFRVTGANILCRGNKKDPEYYARCPREAEKIAAKGKYSFETADACFYPIEEPALKGSAGEVIPWNIGYDRELKVNKWLAPPKDVMGDPNLLLRYSVAPHLFPEYIHPELIGDKTKKGMDLITGKRVTLSGLIVLERFSHGKKIAVVCPLYPDIRHPIPSKLNKDWEKGGKREEVLKYLRALITLPGN